MNDLFTQSGALFSECRLYRFALWRIWGDAAPLVVVLLNPSTADELHNDPTVERCYRRATAMGMGGLVVTNIFAWRATDPFEMRKARDPVGDGNDRTLRIWASMAGMVLCGWGAHGSFRGRGDHVQRLLSDYDLYALGTTHDEQPKHPLYIGYSQQPVLWRARTRGVR